MYLRTASGHGDGMSITPKGVLPPEYAQISEGIGRLATIEAIIRPELLSSVISAVFQLGFPLPASWEPVK